MNQPIAMRKWILGLLAVLLVGVTIVGFSQLGVNPTAGDLVPEEPFPYNTVDSSSCVACHTDETVIAASDWGKDKPVAVNTGGWGAPGPQLEAVQMFLVSEEFLATTHGKLGCISCHGGENTLDKAAAHAEMDPYPSSDFDVSCGNCHNDVTTTFGTSIHYTLAGISNGLLEFTDFTQLSDSEHHQDVFENDCYKCHATCGDCHVSRDKNYSNGLVSEHDFLATPSMEENCYACHNARNGGEYMGTVGFSSDVHYTNGLTCMDCHSTSNFHGTGEETYTMWDEELPSCLDCHEEQNPETAKDTMHKVHGDSLSCQVCHAQANNNCFECHLDEKADGSGLGSSSEGKILFRVGYNPEVSEERPYKYVVLRHVPSQETMLEVAGDDMMPNFDEKSNWKYSPTHNIQKSTFQNESCNACHDNTRIWLSEKDIRDTDSEASRELIPALPPSLDH